LIHFYKREDGSRVYWPEYVTYHEAMRLPGENLESSPINLFLVISGVCLLILGTCFFCIRRFLSKKRPEDEKEQKRKKSAKGQSEIKAVNKLGSSFNQNDEIEDDLVLLENEHVQEVSVAPKEGKEGKEGKKGKDEKKKKKYLGNIKYKVEYDFVTSTLIVTVVECKDLIAMDMNGMSDPYVKIYLLPDKKRKQETKIHRKTLNPVFNETFKFVIPYGEVMGKTLIFAVYDFDRFSKHDEIGEVRLPICNIDLAQVEESTKELQSIAGDGHLGDICFSLRYVPNTGKLTVIVLEAKNLKKMDVGGLSDPYVKMALMQNGKRVRKKKTTIKKCTLNPYYNESFTFDLPFEYIQSVNLLVTVVDYDRVGGNEPIGEVELGCQSKGAELRHWSEMLDTPRRPVAKWHTLKEIKNTRSGLDFFRKRAALTKALSMEASDATKTAMKSLKKTKSVDESGRSVMFSVSSGSGSLADIREQSNDLGSQGSEIEMVVMQRES